MKPISLKLSGLQSYREMQEIDFSALCEMGLFGIFGPTGSGKSTILDAITLAMYGKVGRASGGTQGIMNQSEDSLFVSFTFELMSAKGTERYRVERRFKRQNELSISNTISRFIEVLPEGEQVKADKLADVTRCVEEKIGLKMDDFTRAVVLPQGKFAEFLSLKGADRRAMLQRLFHLEKYGDLLGQKLARKVKETDNSLRELNAEQQGLGNASEEMLREAEAMMKGAILLAETRRRELGDAQQRFDQLVKVRELALEHNRRTTELKALQEREGAIAELEAKLAKATASEQIRPTLTAWKEAERLLAERESLAEAAHKAAQEAEALATQAVAKAEAATALLGREEPLLLQRLDQLEQARILQRECDALLLEFRELQRKSQEGNARRLLLSEETQKEEQLLAKAQHRKQELEELLKGCEVKASERREVQIAGEREQALQMLQEQLSRAEVEESGHRTKAEECALRLKDITLKEQEAEFVCRNMAASLVQTATDLFAIESRAIACSDALSLQEVAMRQALKDRENRVWSLTLAEGLQDGQSCPVCGSVHHPQPALAGIDDSSGSEIQLDEIANLQGQIRELRYALSRDIDNCLSLLELLGAPEAEGLSSLARNQVATSLDSSEKESEPGSIESMIGALEAGREALNLSQQHHTLHSILEELQRDSKAATAARIKLQPLRTAAEVDMSSASGLLEQSKLRSESLRNELHIKKQEWEKEQPQGSLESASARLKLIQDKDAKAEEIKQRLALSVPFIEEKGAKLLALGRDVVELDKVLLQLDTQQQGKEELLKDKQERLRIWTGGADVEKLWNEANQRLQALRLDAQESTLRQSQALSQSHEFAKADVLARQAAIAAQEQKQALMQRWQGELETSPFASEEEVKEAMIDGGMIQSFTEQIRLHRDNERELQIGLKELDTKLDGRVVTDEEWSHCSTKLALAKEQDEEALQNKARTERDLEDLQTRHIRWRELEERRIKLQHEAGLLSKLQSSLRGNAFVEYVAEEQLMNVSQAASQRLRFLTKQRYALETDSSGGFVICDDANGGVKRPVATLSGGETFLTSLALALALSAQIQLRGQYPLQFFFLDEGFGTLDPELLDTVITSLEHLHHDHLSVGIISHVAELRARLPRKLVVIPAESGGEGSRAVLENL
ncbi:AAA family ATPase [Paenibacillus segetis]|uniref:Nuclease SbcCD subunit C n=1 Tax=Paenibacillus segetis TaxID=1325360 RepID=A0ABQ1YHS1_9BACL|nr:AAA family ATPase [Paenibacillus segetis]GGH26740.1 nuclease SbcCD subunit C [Paenibacillus segetis]